MITYSEQLDDVTHDHLNGFFDGWPNPPTPATHLKLLQNSAFVVLARETDGKVVGFINALSDGVLTAYIPLLEVLPAYKGQGIGSELVRRMLAKLDSLYMIDVLCDPDVQPFYERLGLRKATGMMARNYAHQSGLA